MSLLKNPSVGRDVLSLVFIGNLVLFLIHGLPFAYANNQLIYFTAAAIAQAALLSLPAWLLVKLVETTAFTKTFQLLLHIYAVALILVIDANYQVHALYGFYINGFVWNLLSTPGGIEALGLTNSFYLSVAGRVLVVVFIYALLLYWRPWKKVKLSQRLLLFRTSSLRTLFPGALFPGTLYLRMVIFTVFLGQVGFYAYAEHTGQNQILQSAAGIPWYVSVTAKGLLNRLGIERRRSELNAHPHRLKGKLAYPQVAPSDIVLQRRYNIVWLVAESWRADMLNPRVMPATNAFANNNIRFLNHYSGGNGTRMGVFTQFYGLHGNYWFDILTAQQPPLVLDVLRQNDYSLMAYTSARFSYPEFDRTVFRAFSARQLQSYTEGQGWQRDRKNVTDLIDFIGTSAQPFFAFMFFESPHANYYFPPESVIEPDYLRDFNYLDTNFKQQMPRIKARYINASHHLDSQIGRVLQALRTSGKLDNTLVVITGDHGEEFMENNRWGHNSTFSEQQIKVPLVLHLPGQQARVIDRMTSHVDLPVTVLSALSRLENIDPQRISFGHNLLEKRSNRHYLVASDWHGGAIISDEMKVILSPKASDGRGNLFSLDDRPLSNRESMPASSQLISQYLSDIGHFYSTD